ncbi:MAG: hypothetical protein ABW133_22020 [Polyangiaceae bacterium]
MHYRRFAAFVLFIGLGASGCSSESNSPTGTGGAGGSGGSTGGAGGSGGSTGGSGGAAGSGDSGACPTFNYTNYNPTTSPTFKNDIQPIFTLSCALASSCHQNGSTHHPNLGPSLMQLDGGKPTDQMMQTMLEELKKMSVEVAGRAIVAPSKPEDSYLMNKLEGTNNCSGFTCMGPDKCGVQMPDPSTPLEKAQIETVRAWIKKGAPL